MSNTVVGVFPTYQDAKNAAKHIRSNDSKSHITILKKLPSNNEEKASLKLDGIISGVSDVFIGLPSFVNPMASVDLPQQYIPSDDDAYNVQENTYQNKLEKYKDYIASQKIVAVVETKNSIDEIKNCFKQHNAEEVHID